MQYLLQNIYIFRNKCVEDFVQYAIIKVYHKIYKERNNMKKIFSLILSLALLMSTFSAVMVQAADASSYFKEDEMFFFSFENQNDFSYADMKLDNVSNGAFQTSGAATYYTPGAGGSKGAVAAHIEVKPGNQGISNDGISGVKLIPEKEYELSMDIKLLSAENYVVQPNVNVFIMTEGATTYGDSACTTDEKNTGSYYTTFTAKGDTIFLKNPDGTISGEWATMKTTFTLPRALSGSRYLKPNELANVKLFFRFGTSPHSVATPSDFTQEFQDSRKDVQVTSTNKSKDYWIEYAIDNMCLLPVAHTNEAEPEPEPDPRELAFWDNNFEQGTLSNSGDGVAYAAQGAASVTFVDDTPDALPDSTKSLKMVYGGSKDGLMDLNIKSADNSKKLWYNRTYKISFWAKTSEAVSKYAEANPKGSMWIIQERTSEQRLERRKDKWPNLSLNMQYDTDWKYYEILYRETLNESLSRSSENEWNTTFDLRFKLPKDAAATTDPDTNEKIYFTYENDQGETVKCKANDFVILVDNFKVEPTNIVYNGDMAIASAEDSTACFSHYDGRKSSSGSDFYQPGADTFTPSVLGDGAIVADASFAEASGLTNENVLRLTEADGKMHQEVEIDNKKKYTVSFWAKADDEAAVGKNLLPVLDRSIIGDVRDGAETTITVKNGGGSKTINTPGSEDYLGIGYGNTTGETGDVPLMLFSGSMGNGHEATTLNLTNAKEKIVKDDYFGRLKSVNGYEDQTSPTAWNYEYFNGSEWVSTNDTSEFSSNLALTESWKEYTFEYECNYEGNHYRMPEFSIDTDEAANFSLANISITEQESAVEPPPVDENDPEFKAANVTVTSDKTNLTTSDFITVTWDFEMVSGKETQEADGKSIIKMYAVDGDTRTFLAAAKADEAGKATIKASNDLFGKALEFEVIPVDVNGNSGHSAVGTFAGKVVMALNSSIYINEDQASVDWSVNINTAGIEGAYTAYIAQYDADGKLTAINAEPVNFTDGENTFGSNIAVLSSAVTVKLLLWDENMKPAADVQYVTFMNANNDPFADDDHVNVVFLGGSITQGTGSSNSKETCYAALTGKWFESTFKTADRDVTWHNMGVGGTPSQYGLLRLNRDVISKDPDIVFVEFAVNDGGSDTRRYMEGIVRSLQSMEKVPYIVFLYTTNETYTTSTAYHEQVAEFYGIPQISLKDALRRELNGANAREAGYLKDSVHPSDLGYAVYFNEIKKCMETGRYYQKPLDREDKLVPESTGVRTIFTPSQTADLTQGTWETGGTAPRQYVKSVNPGDSFEFEFEGNILAFEHGLNIVGGKYDVYVDDVKVGTGETYYNNITSNQLVLGYNNFNLGSKGKHTAKIVVSDQKNTNSTGNQVLIYNIITGTTLDY